MRKDENTAGTWTCNGLRTLARRSLQLILIALWMPVVDCAARSLSSAPQSTQVTTAEIIAVVQNSFGAEVKVEVERRPFYLSGDFNGDNCLDIAVVVNTKGRTKGLAKDVMMLNPWYAATGPDGAQVNIVEAERIANPENLPTVWISELALAVIHGTKDGWKTSSPLGKYLLFSSVYDEMRVHKGKIGQGATNLPPPDVKGDSIYTGTENAGGIIYWDGTIYRWYQQGD
jgi:hypothetical protein